MIEVIETISPITYALGDSKLTVYPTESLQPACPFSTQSNLKTEMTINQITDSQGQVITASDFIEIKSSPHHDNKIEIEVTDMAVTPPGTYTVQFIAGLEGETPFEVSDNPIQTFTVIVTGCNENLTLPTGL